MDYLHRRAFSRLFFKVLFLISSNDSQSSDTNSTGYVDLLLHTNPPLCFMASTPSQAWRNASDPFISQLTSGYQSLPASSCLSLKETNALDTHLTILLWVSSIVPVSSFVWATFTPSYSSNIMLFSCLHFRSWSTLDFLKLPCAFKSCLLLSHCSGGWFSRFGKVNSMVAVKSPHPLKVSP